MRKKIVELSIAFLVFGGLLLFVKSCHQAVEEIETIGLKKITHQIWCGDSGCNKND